MAAAAAGATEVQIVRHDGQVIAEVPDHSWNSMFSSDQRDVLMAWSGKEPAPGFLEALGPKLAALVVIVLAAAVALVFIFG